MAVLLWLIPVVAIAALIVPIWRVRGTLETALAVAEQGFGAFEAQLDVRRDCLPDLVRVCHVFEGYGRTTLERLLELHKHLSRCKDLGERVAIENGISTFLKDLVSNLDKNNELKRNVFLRQIVERIENVEDQVAKRRGDFNTLVDRYSESSSGFVASCARRFWRLPALRKLEMTSIELLKATMPFAEMETAMTNAASLVDIEDLDPFDA